MKFKGKEYSRTKVKNNILKIWEKCSEVEKYDWYLEAYNFADMNTDNQTDLDKFIGIIAAFSPLKTWEQNKKLALKFWLGAKGGHFKCLVDKAQKIKDSSGSVDKILLILKGDKISSFFLNIRYYNKHSNVTIDRHALSIAIGYKISIGLTSKEYQFFQDCYIYTANLLNVTPLLLQSATWVKYRTIGKE